MIHLRLEPQSDVAYLTLGSEPRPGMATPRVVAIVGKNGPIEIVVDLDDDDRIIGFEFLNASKQLPKSCL